MHVTLAAIRASRPRTRFATPAAHNRQRHLGLQRGPRTTPVVHRPSAHHLRQLALLRGAARTAVIAANTTPGAQLGRLRQAVARHDTIAWSSPAAAGLRRPRLRSAAPWRG